MKPALSMSLLAMAASFPAPSPAAEPAPATAQPVEAFLTTTAGETRRVWLLGADRDTLHFRDHESSGPEAQAARTGFSSICLLEPAGLAAGLELLEARRYREARQRFAALSAGCHGLRALPGNPAANAAYLELECLRKSGALEEFSKALSSFDTTGIIRSDWLRQIGLYPLWEAIQRADWPRVRELAVAAETSRLTAGQLAQARFALGRAMEAAGEKPAAVEAYQSALALAGGGDHADLVLLAGLRLTRLLLTDPAGRPEAIAVARLLRLQEGDALPPDIAALLKPAPDAGTPRPR